MNNVNLSPQEIHDTKFFINFFSQIPEEQWTTGVLSFHGKFCAAGHLLDKTPKFYGENVMKLTYLLGKLHKYFHIISLNDNFNNEAIEYGKTPKERMINALKSLLE